MPTGVILKNPNDKNYLPASGHRYFCVRLLFRKSGRLIRRRPLKIALFVLQQAGGQTEIYKDARKYTVYGEPFGFTQGKPFKPHKAHF
jgi:hypothetical protein